MRPTFNVSYTVVYVTRHVYNFVISMTGWRDLTSAMVTALRGEILTHI